jgi:hypothetical protein
MATDDDVEHEERVRRGAARHRAEQAFLDARDEADRLAETGRQYKDKEREIQAKMTLDRMRRPTPSYRSSYTGPVRNRQIIDGKAIVSREELADFQKRFGANKTLRDLLNADKTGKLPTPAARGSATDTRARGVQGANILPRTEENYPAWRDMQLGNLQYSPREVERNTQIMRDEEKYRKGGKVKAYAKGGSVKGSGCEQRGLRKCKVY